MQPAQTFEMSKGVLLLSPAMPGQKAGEVLKTQKLFICGDTHYVSISV